MTLSFPISSCYDRYINGIKFTFVYLTGTVLIFTAFGVITYIDYKSQINKKKMVKYEHEQMEDGLKGSQSETEEA